MIKSLNIILQKNINKTKCDLNFLLILIIIQMKKKLFYKSKL